MLGILGVFFPFLHVFFLYVIIICMWKSFVEWDVSKYKQKGGRKEHYCHTVCTVYLLYWSLSKGVFAQNM